MAESFFDRVHKQDTHTPDVLACLANLSNDEVFTPPEVVNRMLDMLPKELFESTETTFLDPACKTGVFLREIAKRLLNNQVPLYKEKMELISEKKSLGIPLKPEDEEFMETLQAAIDHIFHKQLYGIAITELTSLLSRRSLYCSKYPNGQYSISRFDNPEGNIRFRKVQHTWANGKCKYCGASQSEYDRSPDKETHAYEFIHMINLQEAFKMPFFDVIISNPPYQLSTAGEENGAQAKPLYHKFIEQAKKLNPNYLAMIVPSRWFAGGWGLDSFRENMITDNHLEFLHDFPNAADCFPGVEIKGGVCYFLWNKHFSGECYFITHEKNEIVSTMRRSLKEKNCDVLIRYNEAVPILHKVMEKGEKTFDSIVSTKKPFGFITNYKGAKKEPFKDSIKLYANKRIEYVSLSEVTKNKEFVIKDKIIIPKAVGTGNPKTDVIKPLYCEPNSCCTETYLLVGPFESKEICENVISYISTKFFHFLVTLQKNTQDCMKKVYSFVPIQDFSKPWTDEELYIKYGLTVDEIAFIESMIKPMELDNE